MICSKEFCDKKVQARGLCSTHYKAWWREKNPERDRANGQRWNEKNREYRREAERARRASIPVEVRKQLGRERRSREGPSRWREAHKRWDAANIEKRRACVRKWARENPDAIRQYDQQRRAREAGAQVEIFSNVEVFERDGWICQLCMLPVDPQLSHPDPLSRSLDHIRPIALGGSHTRVNVQLAHLLCNLRKGAKFVEGTTNGVWPVFCGRETAAAFIAGATNGR